MDAKSSPDKHEQNHYTALVFFHGIGQQRRYEEVSRLVDGLDRYERDSDDRPLQKAASMQFEPTRAGLEGKIGRSTVGYINVSYNDERTTRTNYRFYEAYYADLFAGGLRPTSVFYWLLKLSFRPVKILFTRWRELPGLRRAVLLGYWLRRQKQLSSDPARKAREAEGIKGILNVYMDFVQSQQPAPFPKGKNWQEWLASLKRFFTHGSYGQFSSHLPNYSKKHIHENFEPGQFISGAGNWRRQFLKVQIKIILLVLTALLTIGLALVGIGYFIWRVPSNSLGWNLLIGGIILLVLWGLGSFLRNYVGDLYFWTSYEETSEKYEKREAVMNRCGAYLKHVLSDPNCDRVVLVGHSMGTTVAHATLLRLGRSQSTSNRKSQERLPFEKIQHLITLASVIDKVYYLFETLTSRSHTFNWIIESSRGDLGTHPFVGQKSSPVPRIHWINFWDRADVASSALYTPANYVFKSLYVVDNCEVAGSCFPDPSSAHLDYFNNRTVLRSISEAFFENRYSFVDLPQRERETKLQERFVGEHEKQHRFTDVLHIVLSLTPWLILLRLLGSYFIPQIAGIPFWPALLLYALFSFVLGLLDWLFRYRKNAAAKPDRRAETGPITVS